MRIVITGASGNVGTALLQRLDGTAHDVVGVCRRVPGSAAPYDRAAWSMVDLAHPDAAVHLGPVVDGADVIVHLAWAFQPSRDTAYLGRVGVGGTRAVLAAAVAAGVGQVVHMSSVGAYTQKSTDTPVDESWPTRGIPTLP